MATEVTVRRVCGFKAVKCLLLLINCVYLILAVFLIGLLIPLATLHYPATAAVGVGLAAALLFAVAIVGIVAAMTHHQVVLFCYMILIVLSCLFLFGASVGLVAFANQLTAGAFTTIWDGLQWDTRQVLQEQFDCCGLNTENRNNTNRTSPLGHPICSQSKILTSPGHCCATQKSEGTDVDCPDCGPCFDIWERTLTNIMRSAGAFGIIVSFSMFIPILLCFRYRNLRDPKANPAAYL